MDFSLGDINALAVVVAALVYFFIGSIWYSPVLFANAWMKEIGKSKDELNPNPFIYILCFVLTVIAAFALACIFQLTALEGLVSGLFTGLAAGIAIAAAIAITTMFNDFSRYKLYLINVGYHVVSFTLMGAILGLWQ